MDPNTQRLFEAAAGGAAGVLGVEDVFSTYLYTGNNSTKTITNGIDLSGEGGLVWIKGRGPTGWQHVWVDTVRGATKYLSSNANTAEQTAPNTVPSFSSTGFTAGTDNQVNYSNEGFASWTFRKAPGFFDVVTYTGNQYVPQTISHNLGSVPGCIIIKCTSTAGTNWRVYHRSGGATVGYQLDSTDAGVTSSSFWNNTAPTSTEFTVGNIGDVNGTTSQTYVAYLFAHDDAQFGENEDESIIKCGSFTTDGSSSATINLGFEPQWLMYKRSDGGSESWQMLDVMRGWTVRTSGANELYANASSAEAANNGNKPTSTGFLLDAGHSNNATYIYIAIRRGPMKTPEAGTDVFHAASGVYTTTPITTGFPLDLGMYAYKASDTYKFAVHDRLRGLSSSSTQVRYGLITSSTAAENPTTGTSTQNVTNTSYDPPPYFTYNDSILYSFRRAPGFFDMVAYTGTGAARTVDHNLAVAPELMIFKRRDDVANWTVYHQALGASAYLWLNATGGEGSNSGNFNATTPTASSFSVGGSNNTNASSGTFIAYLFATLPGISKVGSYTGTGSTLDVNCGFSAGARFVLIKRTDSTGDWYVWDSARGITSGNDPYLLLNSTAAEVTGTNYIDTLSSGFQITSSAPAAINASGGSFIFLAVA